VRTRTKTGENTMRTKLNRKGRVSLPTTLTAILAVAITFTLSCSGSDDPDNGGDPNNGGGVPFSENSQVYNEDGTKYTSSGDIKISDDNDDNCILINAGSVTGGIVKLELTQAVPDEYLRDNPDEEDKENWERSCPGYTKGVKTYSNRTFALISNDGESPIGEIGIAYRDEQIRERIEYWYFSKDAKFTCNFEDIEFVKIDAKAGWNKIYFSRKYANGNITKSEFGTKNILTKEARWSFVPN
jgi:hypothetical protein